MTAVSGGGSTSRSSGLGHSSLGGPHGISGASQEARNKTTTNTGNAKKVGDSGQPDPATAGVQEARNKTTTNTGTAKKSAENDDGPAPERMVASASAVAGARQAARAQDVAAREALDRALASKTSVGIRIPATKGGKKCSSS